MSSFVLIASFLVGSANYSNWNTITVQGHSSHAACDAFANRYKQASPERLWHFSWVCLPMEAK